MARRRGIKEKVHLPIYDSISVGPQKRLADVERSGVLNFFIPVRGKTKLETNATLLAGFSGFEAHALRVAISDLPPERPVELEEEMHTAGNLAARLIDNTVTTLVVGDKPLIQMPTWCFGGGGLQDSYAAGGTRGTPPPVAAFRFAEPIVIDKQQNFRVTIEGPRPDFSTQIQRIYGPLFIWVVMDGFMIRAAQR